MSAVLSLNFPAAFGSGYAASGSARSKTKPRLPLFLAQSSLMVNIQIFGVKNSPATRAAERFFKERQVKFQFVDLKQKAMAPAEIKRFIDRFGLPSLLDTEGKAYVDGGFQYLKLTDSELLAKIERTPGLLCLPLVRAGNRVSVGHDEASWKAMVVG